MKSKTKNKVGRPCKVEWGKITFLWKNLTDRAISERAGCSKVNVFLRRKKLIAKAIAAGKDETLYICKLPRYTRVKKVAPTSDNLGGEAQSSKVSETLEGKPSEVKSEELL